MCHGFGEHAGRYHHIAKYFTARGYAVFALDHQGSLIFFDVLLTMVCNCISECAWFGLFVRVYASGHGRSEGDRGYVERFSDYVDDALQWMQWEERETPTEAARAIGKPRLLLVCDDCIMMYTDLTDGKYCLLIFIFYLKTNVKTQTLPHATLNVESSVLRHVV